MEVNYNNKTYTVCKNHNIDRFFDSYSIYEKQNFIGRMIAMDFRLKESTIKFLKGKGL